MCTSILVGKRASMNGSVIIGRNEDAAGTANPKVFRAYSKGHFSGMEYVSENTGVKLILPEESMRMTGTPSEDPNEIGAYTESAINEVNVAISASESLYGNERVLAYDPLVEDGIAEDCIVDITGPFIHSAREGVRYLGNLIEKYGSAEGNGILFADRDEAWYMEIPTGHHWVAQRIPDDCYAIAPNCVCIEDVDFNDEDSFMYSTGIREFVDKYKLNPNPGRFRFRDIFGTSTEFDRMYNTSRAWYAHKYLSNCEEYTPESKNIPFIMKADRLLSIEDVQFVLSSHYNETVYDPIGRLGTEDEKKRYRSISLSRTHESHVLELRSDADEGTCAIHWLALAATAFSPYVAFFANVNDTPKMYRDMTEKLSFDNAYWLFKVFTNYAERYRHTCDKQIRNYLKNMVAYSRTRIEEVTLKAKDFSGEELTAFLTEENNKTADHVIEVTRALLFDIMRISLDSSKLVFKMDSDL